MRAVKTGELILAPHVYACRARDQVVLLDLKHDRYIGMRASDFDQAGLRSWEIPARWVDVSTARGELPATADGVEEEAVRSMLERGFLIEAHRSEADRETVRIERPEVALIEGYADVRVKLRARDVLSVVLAVVTAKLLLRFRTLEQIVERLRRRSGRGGHQPFELDRARVRMAIFNRVRPLLYGEYDACLFTSLAAREFLARDRIFPRLVLGVTVNPFKAHCWLQHGNVVLNDAPAYVLEYGPILAI